VRSPRPVALIAAIMVCTSLLMSGTSDRSSAAQTPSPDSVQALRKQADQARNELTKATKAWEDRSKQLNASEEKLKKTLADLGAADAQLDQIREPLARLAATSYKEPGLLGVPALVGGDDPDQALATATDLTLLSNEQKSLIDKAGQLRKQHEQLAATAQDLQSRNAIEQARLQQEVNGLKAHAATLTAQLTAALKKLDPNTRLRLTCQPSLAAEARKYPNGLIPTRLLCPLPQPAGCSAPMPRWRSTSSTTPTSAASVRRCA
jgi:ABC-type transporter Mla subunit MlaD